MKKFLSLVLALVMTMSLVTISAGAKDFTDDASVKYAEGVKVMDLLGVINGYEDGSFKPANTLTRGAAAKIICNLLLTPSIADTLPADKTGFKDVPSTNTFAKYIAYCANAKIINGYSDGTFRPAATLTGFAFMKMLMGALGYDAQIEGFTGDTFAVNVAAKVGELKLAKGNDAFVGTKAVTREEACLYAFNTLSAAMVKYASKGTKITVNGVEIIQGASAAEKIMDDSGYYTFQEAKFAGLKDGTSKDDFGRVYKTWTYGKTTIKLLASKADKVYYGTLEGKTLYKDLDLTATGEYTVNGEKKTGTQIKSMSWGGLGYMVEVYYTEKTNAITIIPVEYKLGEVTGIVKATEDAGRQIKLKASDGEAATGTAMTFETDSYAKGDMVLYTYTNKKVQSVQAVKTLEGIVSESKGAKLTIGGVKYDSLKALNLAAGSEGTFYLGVDNAIVGFNGKAAVTSSNFAYIYSLVDIAPGVDEDGLPVSGGQRAYFVKADGTKGNAVVSSKSAKIEKDTVIAYSINANGEISVAKPAAGTGTTGAFKTANIGKSYNKVEGFYMSSTTKFVFVDISKGLSITTVDGYKNVVDQKDVIYVVADGLNAKYVFVQAKPASATSDAKYGFLLDTVPSVRKAADNSDLYVFSVMIDGNNKAELISSDADAFKGIAKNDRFSYTEKDGKLASVKAAPAKAEWSGEKHYVEVVGEGYLGLKDVKDTVTLADKCVVYEYDAATNTYAESTVAVNSIVNVYVNAKDEVTMIVIVGEHEAD